MNFQAYTINDTLQQEKYTHSQTHFVHGSHWNISINSNAYLTRFSPNSIHSMQFWKVPHFFHRNHGNVISPHKVRKEKAREPKAVLIRLSDVISSNDETDLSSSTKKTFCALITTKICKSKSISFGHKPTFC